MTDRNADREAGAERRRALGQPDDDPGLMAPGYTAYVDEGKRCVIFEHPVDGSPPRALLETDADQAEIFPTGYAPDGSGLLFSRYEGDDSDLWWLSADGTDARPLLSTKSSEDIGRFSPDGKRVAYESNETGRQEVCKCSRRTTRASRSSSC